MYILKIGSSHLVTPPKCQKLPSSIPKTAHVKFRGNLKFIVNHFVEEN
jgi:hypothetical protein